MKKILIKNNDTGTKFVGYLLEDKDTKFTVLNEQKTVEWHYPKSSHSYVPVVEK